MVAVVCYASVGAVVVCRPSSLVSEASSLLVVAAAPLEHAPAGPVLVLAYLSSEGTAAIPCCRPTGPARFPVEVQC